MPECDLPCSPWRKFRILLAWILSFFQNVGFQCKKIGLQKFLNKTLVYEKAHVTSIQALLFLNDLTWRPERYPCQCQLMQLHWMPNLFIFRWPGYSQSVVDWEMEKSKPVDLLTISVRHVASPCAGNMQQRYPWWLRTQSGGVVISQEVMIGLFALWAMVEPLMWQRVTLGDRVATCVCPQKSNPICLISRLICAGL